MGLSKGLVIVTKLPSGWFEQVMIDWEQACSVWDRKLFSVAYVKDSKELKKNSMPGPRLNAGKASCAVVLSWQ